MQVLALVMLAPRSYTAEDVVELHCHGGAVCARRVLACCLAAGARLARPGEFTLRAFLNGRLDLTQVKRHLCQDGTVAELHPLLRGSPSLAHCDHMRAL